MLIAKLGWACASLAIWAGAMFLWQSVPQDFQITGLVATILVFLVAYLWFDFSINAKPVEAHAKESFVRKQLAKVKAYVDEAPMPRVSNPVQTIDIADTLPIAFFHLNRDGMIVKVSAVARKLLDIKDAELPRLNEVVGGLGQSVEQWLEREFNNPGTPRPQMLKALRASNDVYFQISLARSPKSVKGDFIATLTDATELKSLEAQFVQSQKMQAIGQLAGGVAHDFNNLLTAISGYCDLLMLRRERTDPDYADLSQISQNANRAAALVGQLLAFSRKQKLVPLPVDVGDILSELAHLLNRLVGEKVNLTFDRGKSLPKAFVDSRQLEQVIMNLVVNARDAIPAGGEIVIRTSTETYHDETVRQNAKVAPGTYIIIEVQDNGCGISPELLPKIFDPFVSTKKIGEGTGLGLSTAYGIVKQTGGYIFATSTVGEGTCFQVLLPEMTHQTHRHEDNTSIVSESGGGHVGLNGARVLLVEDEVPVRALVKRALSLQGMELIEAGSAEEALERVKELEDTIDVIISDVVMPGRDGPSWVREGLKTCRSAKVIFISGYAEDSMRPEAAGLEDYEFLPKPFSLKQLTEKVADVLS